MHFTYVFDLDGVIYRGSELQPDAKETVARLRSSGEGVFFLTNNSTISRQQYVEKLAAMGIETKPEDFMTSAYATALYLAEQGGSGKKACVVGGQGIVTELAAVGIETISEGQADYVVVGLDRQFTYEKLARAQNAILNGAIFIATNTDATFPQEGGIIRPGAGSIVAAVATASGVMPIVMGKPEILSARLQMAAAGTTPERTIMIGDRLDTDILAAKRVGAEAVLVLGGINDREDAANAPPEMRPDRIIERLGELIETCSDDSRV